MGWPIHRPIGLTHHEPSRSSKGYTLVCGLGGQDAVLLDMQGRAAHRWRLDDRRLFNVELLANGNLLALVSPLSPPPPRTGERTTRFNLDPGAPPDIFNYLGGRGVGLRELDWDGNIVWDYENIAIHHDFHRRVNGNTIFLEWVAMPKQVGDAVLGGGQLPGQPGPPTMLGDDIVEIDAAGNEVSRIHLWQLLTPEGAPKCPLEHRWEWTHTNSIQQLPDGGLLFSSRDTSIVGIIDPPDPGHVDGADGAATLRWTFGWPELSHQHHATLLDDGRILVYDNGMHRLQDLSYSRIVAVDPTTDHVDVIYQGEPREQFFSAHISGVSQLPNGNFLVTEGAAGRLFEIDGRRNVVWEWISPFQVTQRGDVCNWVFRAWRYSSDYPGLAGRSLDAGDHADFNRLHDLSD